MKFLFIKKVIASSLMKEKIKINNNSSKKERNVGWKETRERKVG